MKIPLCYPKISDCSGFLPKQCVAFEKLDGTNIHWVWRSGVGWSEFGTRRDRFKLTTDGVNEFNRLHPGLEEAYPLFNKVYRNSLPYFMGTKYGGDEPNGETILFTEFLGNNSFAGLHDKEDPKRLVVIDVATKYNNIGIISFNQVFGDFGQFDCRTDNASSSKIEGFHLPKIIYSGKFSGQLVNDIRNGKYNLGEGAVIKGVHKGEIHMCKVKTNAYMEKLKTQFKDNWKEYWE